MPRKTPRTRSGLGLLVLRVGEGGKRNLSALPTQSLGPEMHASFSAGTKAIDPGVAEA